MPTRVKRNLAMVAMMTVGVLLILSAALAPALNSILPRVGPNVFSLSVDYDRNSEEVLGSGCFTLTSPYLAEKNFPKLRQGRQELECAPFLYPRMMTSGEVIADMKAKGFRPAGGIWEAEAFQKAKPTFQREAMVVLLGQKFPTEGYHRVLALWSNSDQETSLYAHQYETGWAPGTFFLAVKD